MKKIILFLICAFFVSGAYSADATQPCVSIFSTSTDWQGVTGLTLNEYNGKFISDKKLVGRGLVLYYLDGFPCYGLGYGVRVWVGPDGKTNNDLHIACVAAPHEINFAYRNAARDADQATTTGILTCPVTGRGRDLTIDLSDCKIGPDWDDYK
jgi:hypothetical protein